ncbi:MAG: DMT family transporter [Candidatus Sigynarchaeota archaeon]
MAGLEWLAITIQIASVTALNIGTIFQKRGADQVPSVHGTTVLNSIKNFLKNKTWMLGYFFIVLGSIGSFVALGFAPFSILQPFMAVGIIVQGIACRWYLKETISKQQIASMTIMVLGVTFVGISTTSRDLTWPASIAMILRPVPFTLVIVLNAIGIAAYAYTKFRNYKNADIWICIFTGINSVFSYLFAKVVMSAVVTYAEAGHVLSVFGDWVAWLILVIAFVVSTAAFLSKNVSYQHGRAVLINNIFNAFNIALPVLVGIVVLDEWAGVPLINIALQSIGVVIIMFGVVWLMSVELKLKTGAGACQARTVQPDPMTDK